MSVRWNNSTIIDKNIVDEITKLKQMSGQEIQIEGSATLVQSLMEASLIDEYRFLVHPIIAGNGKRFFKDGVNSNQAIFIKHIYIYISDRFLMPGPWYRLDLLHKMETFFSTVAQIIDLFVDSRQALSACLKRLQFSKGHILVKQDTTCNYLNKNHDYSLLELCYFHYNGL